MIAENFILALPNWSSQVSSRFIWNTSIKRGIQGNESRSKLNTYPVRSISYSAMIANTSDRNKLIGKFFNYANKVFGVPIWYEGTTLTSQANSGTYVLSCNTTNRSFAQPQLALVTTDHISYEVGVIVTVEDDSLILVDALTSTWVAGSRVYPIIQCRLSSSGMITLDHINSGVFDIDFEFTETYEEYFSLVIGDSVYPTYNGFSVLNIEPNWSSQQSLSIAKPFDLLKYTNLLDHSYTYQSQADLILAMNYTLYTRKQCKDFENFFNTLAGRWGSFWLPTWMEDIKITGAVSSADIALTVEDLEYSANWLPSGLIGRVIMIKTSSGTEIYRYIVAATSNSVTLNSAIGVDISLAELSSTICCFLLPARLDQDEIEFKYITDSVAQIEIRATSTNDLTLSPI